MTEGVGGRNQEMGEGCNKGRKMRKEYFGRSKKKKTILKRGMRREDL